MKFSSRYGVLKNTKTRIINITTAAVLAVTGLGGAVPLFLSQNAFAVSVYSNGFEHNTNNWFNYSGGPATPGNIVQVCNPAAASSGDCYATVDGSMYTQWGGYSSTFPTYGYTTKLDVYLDAAAGANRQFDFSSAINNQSGSHLRDYIFSVGTDGAGAWFANTTNNAPGTPNGAGSVSLTGNHWYTLESNFHNDGSGNLAVRMTISATDGSSEHYWDMDSADVIASQVGGNRYGWFTAQRFDFSAPNSPLSIDNAKLINNPAPTKVYVDDNYSFGNDDGHVYGYDAFNTVEAGLAAVSSGGTVHVYDGTYSNVNLTGTYASNITVKGHSKPTINGINLTGSTFNGLMFDNFNFVGDSTTGYDNFTFVIDGDGSYANLTVANSIFNGQNVSNRGAIFLNRGFTGFNLLGNTFKNYKNSAGVYSIVFAEAQGATMGDGFTATGNSLTNSKATNFLETYLWKNVTITDNVVNAYSGRILVWSDDAASLGSVTIEGNSVTVQHGVGVGVYYVPSTPVSIKSNTIDGGSPCLKVNSVSTVSVLNNTFLNCSTADLEVAETGSTTVDHVAATGNNFSGNPAVKNSANGTVDASNNWWGSNANPAGKTTGHVTVTQWCEQAACTSFTNGQPTTPTNSGSGGSSSSTTKTATSSSSSEPKVVGLVVVSGLTNSAANTAASVLGVASGTSSAKTKTHATVTKHDTTNNSSSNFLGLGWWWLAVLAAVGALTYLVVVRRADMK